MVWGSRTCKLNVFKSVVELNTLNTVAFQKEAISRRIFALWDLLCVWFSISWRCLFHGFLWSLHFFLCKWKKLILPHLPLPPRQSQKIQKYNCHRTLFASPPLLPMVCADFCLFSCFFWFPWHSTFPIDQACRLFIFILEYISLNNFLPVSPQNLCEVFATLEILNFQGNQMSKDTMGGKREGQSPVTIGCLVSLVSLLFLDFLGHSNFPILCTVANLCHRLSFLWLCFFLGTFIFWLSCFSRFDFFDLDFWDWLLFI